jgi:hypothetical protein
VKRAIGQIKTNDTLFEMRLTLFKVECVCIANGTTEANGDYRDLSVCTERITRLQRILENSYKLGPIYVSQNLLPHVDYKT